MNIRKSLVSGSFYPGDKETLTQTLDGFIDTEQKENDVLCAVMPHAGYLYSGATAGIVASNIKVSDTVLILGPKHTRFGSDVAVSPSDYWEFPFGNIPIAKEHCDFLAQKEPFVFDDEAHRNEHSLEVEVPFLWHKNSSINIIPVALGFLSYEKLEAIADGIVDLITKTDDKILLVASTDMSHQIPIEHAKELDNLAIEQILNLNPKKLYETVVNNRISMCGIIPTTVALMVCNKLGAKKATLHSYTTSADTTGDTSAVVGYAGITIK